jgi:hypothetical protein
LENSDGDFEMLEWTATAPGPRLGLLTSPHRVFVDMKREWARIF